jgi:serine/threonine protein kinase
MVLAATDCYLAGRYRLCRWLAAGGMGQVWQAVDEVLGRPVAVKLLRDEYAQDPSFVRRLRAEARYAAAVAHPRGGQHLDYGEVTTTDGAQPTAFLVMELIDGEPLSSLLAREGRLGGWTAAWRSSGRRRWRSGQPTRPGWSTATSSRPTCSSAQTAWSR